MFTTLNLFKAITCPYQETCELLNCLFDHSSRLSHGANEPQPHEHGASLQSKSQYVARQENGSNKRQKTHNDNTIQPTHEIAKHPAPSTVNSETASTRPGTGLYTPQASNKDSSLPAPLRRDKSMVRTLKKPVSPPPFRRAPQAVEQSTKAEQPPNMMPQTSDLQAASAPVKAEFLMPRNVKQPPAKFDMRMTIVQKFHEQHVRLNDERLADEIGPPLKLISQDLIRLAVDEEEKFAKGVSSTYGNLAKLHLMKLKKMKKEEWASIYVPKKETSIKSSYPGSTDNDGVIKLELNERQKLSVISKFEANPASMLIVGYARTKPTASEVETAKAGVEASRGWEQCVRCQSRFQVFPGRHEDGRLTSGGACSYHWGKPVYSQRDRSQPASSDSTRSYSCCNEAIGTSPGCTRAESHVFKISDVKRQAAVLQFEITPPNPNIQETNAFCMDCEMGFSTHGLELIRLTVTSWPSDEEVIDVLVRPKGEILDLNSRFSGVFLADITQAKVYDVSDKASLPTADSTSGALKIISSPSEARKLLWRYINPSTYLIGHALENDLNALRMIHTRVIDTAFLFPHKKKLPIRHGLKYLMSQILQKSIQLGDLGQGHDSKEDARAAGELVKWKLTQEWAKMQKQGWTIDEGGLLFPPNTSHKDTLESDDLLVNC